MPEFIRLKPNEYTKHYILNPPDFIGEATWYVHSTSYNSLVRWFTLAFLKPIDNPRVLTFRFCSYDEDYLPSSLDHEVFEVFYHSYPGKSLKHQTLKEIVTLLRQHAQELTDNSAPKLRMFEPIPEAEWPKFHLGLLYPDQKDFFYRQMYDPLDPDNNSGNVTLLLISGNQDIFSKSPPSMSIRIYRFLKDELNDPGFNPANSWLGHINLDRQGVFEFIQLLEEGWSILTSS